MKLAKWFTPARNLSPQERGLQVIRLLSAGAVILLIVAALVGSLLSDKVYISRINCAHLDVSYGLYKSLRTLVSSSPSLLAQENSAGVYPMDSSLTNSEITVLTNYAESQVANAPQYTFTSMWRWCYGNYNTTHVLVKDGKYTFKKHNDVIKCSSNVREYVFDYRGELTDIGLDSILAYAYQTSTYEDLAYLKATAARNAKYKRVPGAIIFAAVSQAVLLLLTYVVYLDMGADKRTQKQQTFIMNILAVISLASFLALTIGVGFMTAILLDVRLEVHKSLNDFGVSFHLGKVWFCILWAATIMSLVSTASWTLPLWCANPPEDYDEELEAGLPRHYRRTTDVPQTRQRTRSGSNPLLNQVFIPQEDPGYHSEDHLVQHPQREPTFTTEEELRRLGESLSRTASVRHLNRNTSHKRTQPTFTAVTEDPFDTASVLENDDLGSQHYREETYDGYQNVQRYTNVLQHGRSGLRGLNLGPYENTDAQSFLNEDEIHFLDHNNFINKM